MLCVIMATYYSRYSSVKYYTFHTVVFLQYRLNKIREAVMWIVPCPSFHCFRLVFLFVLKKIIKRNFCRKCIITRDRCLHWLDVFLILTVYFQYLINKLDSPSSQLICVFKMFTQIHSSNWCNSQHDFELFSELSGVMSREYSLPVRTFMMN